MLKVDTLKANKVLSGLSDEQLSAIAEMSKTDEETVIATRIGQLHGQYESDIFNITGIQKNDGEKAYNYNKRVLAQFKEAADKATTLKADYEKVKTELENAQNAINNNSQDAALKQQLEDSKTQVKNLQKQLSEANANAAAEKVRLKVEYDTARVNSAIDNAMSGISFKDGITEPLQKALKAQAKAEIFARGKAEIDEKGTIIFRGEDGAVLTNPNNSHNPYTIQELLSETSIKDATANKQVSGGGTHEPGKSNHSSAISISGARTQIEADEMIASALMSRGLTTDSQEYHTQFAEARSQCHVEELPLR